MSRTRNRSTTDMSDMSDRARLNRIIDFCQNHAAAPPPDDRALPFEPDNDGCTEHWVDLLIRFAERGLEVGDVDESGDNHPKPIVRLGHGTDEHPPSKELVQALEHASTVASTVGKTLGIDYTIEFEIAWLETGHVVKVGKWNVWGCGDSPTDSPREVAWAAARTAFYQSIRGDHTDSEKGLRQRIKESYPLWGIVDE